MSGQKTNAPRGQVVKLPPLLLKDRDAAAAIARSPSWIRAARAADVRAQREGRPPTGPKWITIDKSVFYRLADLDDWIAANAQERGVIEFSNRGTRTSTTKAAP